MFLSIIIPVYNVELYLEECLKSIVDQWHEGIEIILVNDGSTDNSGKLCQEFILLYPFVKLVNRENGGLSAARNTGLDIAIGEYVWFVDSDDFIVKDALAIVIDTLQEKPLDILRFGFELFEDGTNKVLETYSYSSTAIMSPIDYFKKEELLIQAWAGIYRKGFLKDNQLRFYEGLIYEDVCFNLEAYSYYCRFKVINNVLYKYRARLNSLLRSAVDKKKADSVMRIIALCDDLIEKKGVGQSVIQVKKKYDYIILLIDFLIELKDTDYQNQIWNSINYKVPLLKNDPIGLKVYKLFLRFFPKIFYDKRRQMKLRIDSKFDIKN